MATKKPNIVMIYADNHPGAVIGYAGNAEAYTPNLDRLSQNATLFYRGSLSQCNVFTLPGISSNGINAITTRNSHLD